MALVTNQQVKDYASVFPATETPVTDAVKTAEEIVFNRLGFNPAAEDYSVSVIGLGDGELYLPAFPVIGDIIVNGTEYLSETIGINKNVVEIPDVIFLYKSKNAVVFRGGYETGTIPQTIMQVIIQIAALLLTECGHIGVSGTSDQNTGTRTFISYTNFEKYLKNIEPYRLRTALI